MKMLRTPKRLARDARGVSLIELIVAMTVLAVVAAPLLRSFVSGASVAVRASNTGDATLAAQNFAEKMYPLSIDYLDLLGGNARCYRQEGSVLKPAAIVPSSEKNFAAAFRNINLTGSATSYDAVVSFDAEIWDADNSVGVTQYTQMDAVFAQPYTDDANPDKIALGYLEMQAYGDISGYNLASGLTKISEIKRTITVSIDHSASERTISVSVEYRYTATFGFNYYDHEGTGHSSSVESHYMFPFEIYRNRYPIDADYKTALKNIFIFYYPAYALKDSAEIGYSQTDDIIIKNNIDASGNPLKFEVYLIKQKLTGAYAYDTLDSAYSASVKLYQNADSNLDIPLVYTNIGDNLYNGGSNSIVSYDAYVGYTYYRRSFAANGLVKITPENRIYKYTLMLFPAGTLPVNLSDEIDLSSLSPLVTLTGSKLN